jgi:hypothetical protein
MSTNSSATVALREPRVRQHRSKISIRKSTACEALATAECRVQRRRSARATEKSYYGLGALSNIDGVG